MNDKCEHFIVGLSFSVFFGLIFCPLFGVLFACVVGLLKEVVWDWLLGKGCFEIMDFVATSIGGLVGYVFLVMF